MIWERIKHFSPREKWGDPKRINPLLLLVLDLLRDRIGKPFIVHCAYETTGHTQGSYHYTGDAVDFHISCNEHFGDLARRVLKELDNILLLAGFGDESVLKMPYSISATSICGLGIYPDWAHPGFHLDVRGYPARWGRIGSKYVSLDEALAYADEREGARA